jgi:hypothetical protein
VPHASCCLLGNCRACHPLSLDRLAAPDPAGTRVRPQTSIIWSQPVPTGPASSQINTTRRLATSGTKCCRPELANTAWRAPEPRVLTPGLWAVHRLVDTTASQRPVAEGRDRVSCPSLPRSEQRPGLAGPTSIISRKWAAVKCAVVQFPSPASSPGRILSFGVFRTLAQIRLPASALVVTDLDGSVFERLFAQRVFGVTLR